MTLPPTFVPAVSEELNYRFSIHVHIENNVFVLTFDSSMAHFQYVAYTQKYMKTITIGTDVMQNSNGTPNTMNIIAQSKTTAWSVI